MSLDVILTQECTPRSHFADGELISLSNALYLHEELHQDMSEDCRQLAPPGDELILQEEEVAISLGDLRERLKKALPRLGTCIGCPLNVTGRPIGCHVRVDYPIDTATERTLARLASRTCVDPEVAEALMARTPVATPAFRRPDRGMFESPFAPYVDVPWGDSVKGVSLDAFWDMLLEPRTSDDGVAVARILVLLRQELAERDDEEESVTLHQLALLGFALGLASTMDGQAGYAVSG